MTFLLDSDVIFDFISSRIPYYQDMEQLLTLAEQQEFRAVTLPHLVVNIWQVRGHMQIENIPMQKSLAKLLTIVKVLDEPAEAVSKALLVQSPDFEDWVTVESAIIYKADGIVSRNTKHFKKSPIQVFTPSQLIQKLVN